MPKSSLTETNTSNAPDWIRQRMAVASSLQQTLLADDAFVLQLGRIAERLTTALRDGNQILFMGNGGSAADAQHLAGELVGRFYKERRGLPAQALTTNTSIITAIGNDYGYERVFARQVEAYGRARDVAYGLSTSGKSENVVQAMHVARAVGLYTVAFTGRLGGVLVGQVDECVCIPADETPRIQEAHILCGHILCEWVEQALFAPVQGASI